MRGKQSRPGPDGHGTVLAVVPVNGGASRLAIVGYLLPPHPEGAAGPAESPLAEPPPAADGLVVDTATRRVVVSGRDAGLAFREYELMAFLTSHPGRVFTRAQLMSRVWAGAREGTSRTVDIHVHRLRRKLGPVYAGRVVTVRRVGYLYEPPVPRTVPLDQPDELW
jgi:DNA-binding winged helix-turn-helix (wHTH) protein